MLCIISFAGYVYVVLTQVKFCVDNLVPELGNMSEPTASSSVEYITKYAKYAAQYSRNYGSGQACAG